MERIFYKSDISDAYSGLPIYVFDTSYLPTPDEIDYDLFVPTLMRRIPQEPYVVIMFSCGLNNINWVWGVTFLKAFMTQDSGKQSNVENLHKIIAVHESWFVKSICSIFSNFLMSRKSLNKLNLNTLFQNRSPSKNFLISCDSLSDLSSYVDIVHLKLSLNLYRHDCQVTLSPTLKLHSPINPVIKPSTDYSQTQSPLFYHHFYQIFHIIDIYAGEVELLFHKPGKKLNTDILFLCLMRNQLIWVNDWDLNCIASCFKKILAEVSEPLLPVDCISLPMKDTFDYTFQIFAMLMDRRHKNEVLFQIFDLCNKIVSASDLTKHTALSVSKSLVHAVTHEPISHQSQHRVSMAVRYMKNVIVHWDRIRPLFSSQFKTVQQVIDDNSPLDATINESYNMSHDISLDDGVSSEEDRSHQPGIEKDFLDADVSSSSLQSNSTYIHSGLLSENNSIPHPFEDSPVINPNSVVPEPTRAEGVSSSKPHSSIQIQFPPQKYKFEKKESQPLSDASHTKPEKQAPRLPVIRGRKVGELTRIFEERTRAIEILKTM